MFRRLLLVSTLAVLCLGFWDAPMTKLSVQVTTQGGKPIDRAGVIVRFLGSRQPLKLGRKTRTTWEVRTNQEGMVTVPPIPQGKIQIQVIAKGYQTFGQNYEINEEEKTVEIKLNPPQTPYSAHQ